jgi:hypothetical protein
MANQSGHPHGVTMTHHFFRTRRRLHREINQEWLGSGAGGNDDFLSEKNWEEL